MRDRMLWLQLGIVSILASTLALHSCGGGGGSAPAPLPARYSIGGTVSGLSGTGLVLRNNGADDLGIATSGTFTFAAKLASSAAYSVTVQTHPVSLTQACAVTGGSGTVAAANVTSVLVSCITRTYSVGGTVSGLTGTGLTLLNNGGNSLAVASSGTFTFTTWIDDGGLYSVTVVTQPSSPVQACVVSNGTGTIAAASITNVSVACTTTSLSVGAVCSGDGQCASGSCECADASCATKRCSAANCVCTYVNVPGVCTFNFAIGTDPGNDCPGYQCNGSGACLTSCATINDCDADRYCNVANSCVLKNAVGTPCSGSDQCMNGFCRDGVCCESSCTGGTCDFTGNCTGSASGSQCSASDQCNSGTCSGGVCQ